MGAAGSERQAEACGRARWRNSAKSFWGAPGRRGEEVELGEVDGFRRAASTALMPGSSRELVQPWSAPPALPYNFFLHRAMEPPAPAFFLKSYGNFPVFSQSLTMILLHGAVDLRPVL